MRLLPYPRYRPSGANWLGNIPEHWALARLKMVADLVDSKIEVGEDRAIPYVGMANVESWTGQLSSIDQVIPIGTANKFESEHTLFGKLRPYLAKAWNPTFNGICSTEFLVLKSTLIDRKLLLYFLLSDAFIREVNSSTFGSKMPRANWDFIGDRLLPIIPLIEQQNIVRFLDQESAKTDELIKKMKALSERIIEKRTALISYIVTRGIPSNSAPPPQVGLRYPNRLDIPENSWLHSVPSHWDILPLKRFHRVVNGGTPSSHEENFWGGGINWITPEDLGKNRSKIIGESRRTLSSEGLANCNAQLVPRNSIVISTRAPIGHVAVVSRSSCTNQGCRSLVPTDSRACMDYIYYAISSSRDILKSMGKGTTFMELSAELLGLHRIPVPPIDEQFSIARFLDQKTSTIDMIVSRIETAVILLQEYRNALVTATVTGAIDVRQLDPLVASQHGDGSLATKIQEQSVAIGTVTKDSTIDLDHRTRRRDSVRRDAEGSEGGLSSMGCVPVKPALLTWARERASYSLQEMSVQFPKIADWERGEAQPTFRQLEAFADTTHAPIGSFFLPEPPVETMPIPDLRTVASESLTRPSPDLLDTIYFCQRQQNWYRDFMQSVHESELEFVGSAQVSDDIVETAARMRETLGFDLNVRTGSFRLGRRISTLDRAGRCLWDTSHDQRSRRRRQPARPRDSGVPELCPS